MNLGIKSLKMSLPCRFPMWDIRENATLDLGRRCSDVVTGRAVSDLSYINSCDLAVCLIPARLFSRLSFEGALILSKHFKSLETFLAYIIIFSTMLTPLSCATESDTIIDSNIVILREFNETNITLSPRSFLGN